MTTSILVPGTPATMTAQQKGVSWRNHNIFTKAAARHEENRIKRKLMVKTPAGWRTPEYPLTPYEGPVFCQIRLIFALTLQQATKYADKISDPSFELRHLVRPDVDNSCKLILDTLTRLRFWKDDSQVDDLRLSKRYGSDPRIEIYISTPT